MTEVDDEDCPFVWLGDALSTTACDELLGCVLGDGTEVVSAFVVFFAIDCDCCDFCLVCCALRFFGDDVAFVSDAAGATGVDFFRGIEPSSSA